MKLFSGLLAMLVLATFASGAFAQSDDDKAQARTLYTDGNTALKANDCAGAADKFSRAEKLYHAPTILVGLGRAYVCLGKFVRAKEQYNKVIREPLEPNAPDAFKKAVEDAKAEIVGLDAKIGFVTITINGPVEPVVTVDKEPVPVAALGVKRPVDAGTHVVQASANGYRAKEQSFTVVAGQEQAVTLSLDQDPDAVAITPPGPGGPAAGGDSTKDTLQLVGFVAIGVGAAGLIVGAITGGLAIGKHGDLEDSCPNGQCPETQQDTLDSYNTLGTVSTITFIAGGVVAAVGIVLVVIGSTGGSTEQAALEHTTLELGPGSLRLRGTF
jgi:hypothetical protein